MPTGRSPLTQYRRTGSLVTSAMLAGALAAGGLTADASSPAGRWWSHVQALAGDAMQGRMTGSPEHREAAEYVAAAFARAGLEPAGTNGYYQGIAFHARRLVEQRTSVEVVRTDAVERLELGTHIVIGLRHEPAERIDAPLAFVGYGLRIPDAGHDDLAGLDLGGRIAIYVVGQPAGVSGAVYARYQPAHERWQALRERGAIGMVAIRGAGQDVPWERFAATRFAPVLTADDPALQDTPGLRFSATASEAGARVLLRDSAFDVGRLLVDAEARRPLPRGALSGTLRARLGVEARALSSDNVLGMLPGADPALRDQHVVLTAHLDHVGVGEAVAGDRIHNGAMDNASGIATLIETARAFQESGKRPRRSLVFAAVTAEEQGLLGSRYWAEHPTVPRASIVANINVDMFLPLFPMKSVIALGADESDLGADLAAVAAAEGIPVVPDPEPERRAFVRSDQYSFIRNGIPALALKVGYAKETPEHEVLKRWRRDRYHAPADDLTQPVDFEAAAAFNRFYAAVVERVANRETRPRWNEHSYFRRFAAAEP